MYGYTVPQFGTSCTQPCHMTEIISVSLVVRKRQAAHSSSPCKHQRLVFDQLHQLMHRLSTPADYRAFQQLTEHTLWHSWMRRCSISLLQ